MLSEWSREVSECKPDAIHVDLLPEDFIVTVSEIFSHTRTHSTALCLFDCVCVLFMCTVGIELTPAPVVYVAGGLYGLWNEGEESCEQCLLLLQEQPH